MMRIFNVLLILSMFFILGGCKLKSEKQKTEVETVVVDEEKNEDTTFYKNIEYGEFLEVLKNEKIIIIDVRTESEYNSGHIKGSLLIDFYNPNFIDEVDKLDKEKTYLLYCRTGNRSGQAMNKMSLKNFKRIYNLMGGIVELNRNNYPLVTEE